MQHACASLGVHRGWGHAANNTSAIASLCRRLAMGAGEDIDTTCTPYLGGPRGPRGPGPRGPGPGPQPSVVGRSGVGVAKPRKTA